MFVTINYTTVPFSLGGSVYLVLNPMPRAQPQLSSDQVSPQVLMRTPEKQQKV